MRRTGSLRQRYIGVREIRCSLVVSFAKAGLLAGVRFDPKAEDCTANSDPVAVRESYPAKNTSAVEKGSAGTTQVLDLSSVWRGNYRAVLPGDRGVIQWEICSAAAAHNEAALSL